MQIFTLLIISALSISPANAIFGFGKKKDKHNILKEVQEPTGHIKIAPQDLLYQPIEKEKIQAGTQTDLPSELVVEVIADEIRYNQDKTYYEAIGNSEAVLPSKDAHLYADRISYDSETKLLEAFGNIKIVQVDNIIYGSYASFNTETDKYELDDPKLFIEGLKLKARIVESTYDRPEEGEDEDDVENILTFKDGVTALDQPISIYAHGARTMTRYSKEIRRHNQHQQIDWNDLTDKSTLRYTAKEIFIDDTRETNNLRIKGARIWINEHLSIPSPIQITTSVGDAASSQFKGPVIGTRERIGGFALGPRFYHERDHGLYSFVPIAQIGNGPKFGGGGIASFNTYDNRTNVMAGYGSLNNRFIGSFRQKIYKYFEANALFNQFRRSSIFGTSQVGQFYELASNMRLKLPFADERGVRLRISGGWAKDNAELFTNQRREDLNEERDDAGLFKEHDGFRSEIETSFYTQPLWRKGNELYNTSLRLRGQGTFRFYDTGDFLTLGRLGPALEARVDNFAFEIDYLFAALAGESPFLFDQFVDGNQSVIFDGDYKVNKWFSFGTLLTYNVDRERFVRNEFRTEVGPEDFKIRLSYDVIRNQIDLGFNVHYGEPVNFDTLRVKI